MERILASKDGDFAPRVAPRRWHADLRECTFGVSLNVFTLCFALLLCGSLRIFADALIGAARQDQWRTSRRASGAACRTPQTCSGAGIIVCSRARQHCWWRAAQVTNAALVAGPARARLRARGAGGVLLHPRGGTPGGRGVPCMVTRGCGCLLALGVPARVSASIHVRLPPVAGVCPVGLLCRCGRLLALG